MPAMDTNDAVQFKRLESLLEQAVRSPARRPTAAPAATTSPAVSASAPAATPAVAPAQVPSPNNMQGMPQTGFVDRLIAFGLVGYAWFK